MNAYSRPVPSAMACIFFVFKKPRTAQEIADLTELPIDRVRSHLRAALAEGIVKRARLPRTGRASSPYIYKRAI